MLVTPKGLVKRLLGWISIRSHNNIKLHLDISTKWFLSPKSYSWSPVPKQIRHSYGKRKTAGSNPVRTNFWYWSGHNEQYTIIQSIVGALITIYIYIYILIYQYILIYIYIYIYWRDKKRSNQMGRTKKHHVKNFYASC